MQNFSQMKGVMVNYFGSTLVICPGMPHLSHGRNWDTLPYLFFMNSGNSIAFFSSPRFGRNKNNKRNNAVCPFWDLISTTYAVCYGHRDNGSAVPQYFDAVRRSLPPDLCNPVL